MAKAVEALVEASREHWKRAPTRRKRKKDAKRRSRKAGSGTQRRIAEEQKKAATAQRRTAQVALGALVIALLVAAAAVWQYFKATEAGERGDEQAQLSLRNAKTAEQNAKIAEKAADEAKKDALAQRDRAVQAEEAAKNEKKEAEASAEQAKANLREAQIAQSRFLADLAHQARTEGDAGSAVLLALEALPDAAAGDDRPYVPEAELQLDGAWRDLRERLVLGHEDVVMSAAFSPDGKRIVTASEDKTARVWDAATGKPIGEPLKGHEDAVSSAAFSPDGKRIVTASRTRRRGSGTPRAASRSASRSKAMRMQCGARRSAPTASASSPRL